MFCFSCSENDSFNHVQQSLFKSGNLCSLQRNIAVDWKLFRRSSSQQKHMHPLRGPERATPSGHWGELTTKKQNDRQDKSFSTKKKEKKIYLNFLVKMKECYIYTVMRCFRLILKQICVQISLTWPFNAIEIKIKLNTLYKSKSVTYMPSCSSKDDAMCTVLNNSTHKISGNIVSASYGHERSFSTGAASVSIKWSASWQLWESARRHNSG